jgi:hypothetical protein
MDSVIASAATASISDAFGRKARWFSLKISTRAGGEFQTEPPDRKGVVSAQRQTQGINFPHIFHPKFFNRQPSNFSPNTSTFLADGSTPHYPDTHGSSFD